MEAIERASDVQTWLKAVAELAEAPEVDPLAFTELVGRGARSLLARSVTDATPKQLRAALLEIFYEVEDGVMSQDEKIRNIIVNALREQSVPQPPEAKQP